MKILLLTDIPPDRSLTAGLVLDRVCRFLPSGSVACFAVVNPTVNTMLSSDLPGVSTMFVDKPREDGLSEFGARGSRTRALAERFRGFHDRNFAVPALVRKAARFAREQKVDAVWAVLQGQTMIHMARPLARKLKLPLFTLVWDPLSWWLKSFEVEPHTSKLARREFDAAILASRAVATASWAMTAEYDKKYHVYSVPVIASHDRKVAQSPEPRIRTDGELVIGMAGQFYARGEWDQLIIALNACNWMIGGRHVRISVAGHHVPETSAPPGKITKLGWLAHPDLVKRLSECDILYCPYPFDKEMDEVSRLSFPSKLVAYLAAGRPTVFHGPEDASPGRYVAETGSGLVALGPQASAIYNVIERLALNPELFRKCAENAHQAFLRDFTFETMKRNFHEFLRINDASPALSLSHSEAKAVAGLSATASPPSEIIDRRSPRLRQKRLKVRGRPAGNWKLKILRRTNYVRHLEARTAELSHWQDVHAKELTGLYAYVKQLTDEANAQRQALERQEAEAAGSLRLMSDEYVIERDTMRERISLRDGAIVSLSVQLAEAEAKTGRFASELQAAARELDLSKDRDRDLRTRMQSMTREWEEAVAQARAEARDAILALHANRDEFARNQTEFARSFDELSQSRDELANNISTLAQARQQLEVGLNVAVERLKVSETRARDVERQRDEIAVRGHEDAIALQQRQIELEAQIEAFRNGLGANDAPNAERISSLIADLQIARAVIEERSSMLTMLQAEQHEYRSRHNADMLAAIQERDEMARRIVALEERQVRDAKAAADLDEMRAVLTERDRHLARILVEREEAQSRLASETRSLNRNLAVLEADRAANQSQLVRVLELLSEMQGQSERGADRSGSSVRALYIGILADLLSARENDASAALADAAISPKSPEPVLAMISKLAEAALDANVAGDFAEVSAFGSEGAILMCGILNIRGEKSRKIWTVGASADPVSGNVVHYLSDRVTGVDAERAKSSQRNFSAYGLGAVQVKNVDGASDEALAKAGTEKFAFIHLRFDGRQTLSSFGKIYARLSPGGSVLVSAPRASGNRELVVELRERFGVQQDIQDVDGVGFCWTLPPAEAPVPPRSRGQAKPVAKSVRASRPTRRRQSS